MTDKHLIVSVILYCVIHSITADSYLMKNVYTKWWYRAFYVFFSIITVIPVVYIYLNVEKQPFFDPAMPIRIGLGIIWLMALGFGAYASRCYDNSSFLGLTQIINRKKSDDGAHHKKKLVSTGALGIVRHPYYTAGLVLVWARPMNLSDFYITLILTAYFILGTLNEERKLMKEFGAEYTEYKKRVPMLIPYPVRKNEK
ncbi:MAG: isoprenylcysteine carboxylmethyltransferase family protein [Deferribacterales bacterium]